MSKSTKFFFYKLWGRGGGGGGMALFGQGMATTMSKTRVIFQKSVIFPVSSYNLYNFSFKNVKICDFLLFFYNTSA